MLYTGAACYAGLAALRTGADTVHVFCDAAAAAVIRAFSCELVVHPVLDQVTVISEVLVDRVCCVQEFGMEEIDAWLPRLDCLVIGPGLGRNQSTLGRISLILRKAVTLNIPAVIDGDALWQVSIAQFD